MRALWLVYPLFVLLDLTHIFIWLRDDWWAKAGAAIIGLTCITAYCRAISEVRKKERPYRGR